MGAVRKFSPHNRWTDHEQNVLMQHYHKASWETLYEILPGRGQKHIQGKANLLGLTRFRSDKINPEERARRKRDGMARRRAADPEAARAYRTADWVKNRKARLATMKAYQRRRFFWMRTMKLSGINAKDLASLWRKQRGLCALTGENLTRENAEVDHILPRKRGGGDEIANLRWTTKTANRMKRDMTDEEFVSACENVMSWIGQRIQEAAQ